MYKELNKNDWLKFLKLSPDYTVDAVIFDGNYKEENRYNLFIKALQELKIDYKEEAGFEDDFLAKYARSFIIENKRFWYGVFYGGALLSEILHLACMFGSQINLFRGDCGALQPGLNKNDVVIPTFTFGNESSTRMYAKNREDYRFLPDKKVVEQIQKALEEFGIKTKKAAVVTCQAMLAETLEDVKNWSKDGYGCVEMETSTFFAVSEHFNVPSGAILLVADNLVTNELVVDEAYINSHKSRDAVRVDMYKALIKTALKTLGAK